MRVSVATVCDPRTVSATYVALNTRSVKSLMRALTLHRLTVGHFGWPVREKFS